MTDTYRITLCILEGHEMAFYTDINLALAKHPFTDDVMTRTDVDAVKNALYNLVFTKKYEKPFNPDFGTDITNLLFENWDPLLASYYETKIREVIEEYEPRVKLERVSINDSQEDNNSIECTIEFYVRGINSLQTLNLDFERIR